MKLILPLLAAALSAAAQQLTFTPFHQNGVYNVGESAGWMVTRPAGSASPDKFTFTIKKNNLDVLKTGILDLSSGTATIEITVNEPAMLYVEVNPEGAVAPPSKAYATLGAAIAPHRFEPAVPRPADFDAFWESKLKALREIPVNPQLTPVDSSVPGVELSMVKLDSLGSHVQGYLAKPQREGKFPALVIYQYAGIYALQPETVTTRAAEGWLAFDVDSHDMAPNQSTGPPTNYQQVGNTDRETSYFLKMYLRDTRAIDYIATRPDWDGKTIVVMGTSMGGQQSLVTARLNSDKVTALIVNEPAGADSNGNLHGRRAGYPNWDSKDPRVMQTALYFDTVNFATRIQAPSLVAVGFIDTIAPPAGIWTAVNQIPAPKEVVAMVESDHNNITPDKQEAFKERSEAVLRTILEGGKFQPDESLTRPESARRQVQTDRWKLALETDPADLKVYREANAKLPPPAPGENRVVFLGDSITAGWARYFSTLFPGKPYIGRGISSETTQQMLIRFRPDVIDLHPKVVVILAGTNDIAGNTGRSTQKMIEDNIASMVDLAQVNGIRVVLVSVLPADEYWWQPGMEPAEKIVALNNWMNQYAAKRGIVYVDCHTPMSDAKHAMKKELSPDGVHPNAAGYAIMGPLVEAGVAQALQ
ncbi:MAG: acetylxylan esterase [Acidobacteriia bacterium]|nr:acetylxylan esterase [Terriglobia bacterium]